MLQRILIVDNIFFKINKLTTNELVDIFVSIPGKKT